MNEPEAERPPASGPESTEAAGEPDPAAFELPDQADDSPVRLRRRLFGYRAADVEAELSSRRQELVELRRDVAALWLAFAQHERTIHRVLGSLERLGGEPIDPPGGRRDPEPGRAGPLIEESQEPVGAGEGGGDIATRLSELDHVLEAIERATASLERSYTGELQRRSDAPEPGEVENHDRG